MTINYKIKNNANFEKTILIVGVFHGDEAQGEYFINEYLKTSYNGKNRLIFVPRLNNSNTRKNPNGVDLNRNFPTKNWELTHIDSDYYGGEEPASEIETKFMVDLIEKYEPNAIITIHAPYKIVNFDPNNNETKELAQKISDILGYPIEADIGYPTSGSFGTYCGIERNIPTITIEIDEEADIEVLNKKFNQLFLSLEDL